MTLVVVVIVAFACGIGIVLWMTRKRPPDDAQAVGLAAELGGTRPTLVKTPAGVPWAWCFEVDLEGPLRIVVHSHGLRVQRLLSTPIGEPARILTEPLLGRAQEEYALARTLVPEDRSFVVGGQPGERPAGWELRLRPALLDELARIDVDWLAVERDRLETGCREPRGAGWVREVAAFLRDTERTLRGA